MAIDYQALRFRNSRGFFRPAVAVRIPKIQAAPPISTILPRFLYLRFEQNRSVAFQSLLDLLAAETAQPGLGH
jgi:hypothetical protein